MTRITRTVKEAMPWLMLLLEAQSCCSGVLAGQSTKAGVCAACGAPPPCPTYTVFNEHLMFGLYFFCTHIDSWGRQSVQAPRGMLTSNRPLLSPEFWPSFGRSG